MNPIIYPQKNEIMYLKADINYTIFHLACGQKMVSSFTLKKHQNKVFSEGFIRPHRSYLINPAYISQIQRQENGIFITLITGEQIQASRRNRRLFRTLSL